MLIMGVDFRWVGGARAQQICRCPSGDLDLHRLFRLQSQVGRAGVEFGELEHPQLHKIHTHDADTASQK